MKHLTETLLTKEQKILIELINNKEMTNEELAEKLNLPLSTLSDGIITLFNEGFIIHRKAGKYKIWSIEDAEITGLLSEALLNLKGCLVKVEKIILDKRLKELE